MVSLMAVALAIAGVAWPPYSAVLVVGGVIGAWVLAARPDVAFMLFFAAETLISEDILLPTNQLAETIYYIQLPGIGINVFEVGLLALTAAMLMHRKGRLYGTRLDISMGLFGLACLIGYITCIQLYGDPGRLFEPRRLLHFFLAYLLTVNLIRTKSAIRLFLLIYLTAVVLKATQGLFLYTLGEGLEIKWRIRAIFTGWGDSLNFVTFLLILAAFFLDRTPMWGKRFFLWATPVVIFSLMFSYKRAYYVALVVGLCVLGLLQKGRNRLRFLGLAMLAMVAGLILITVSGQWYAIGQRFASIVNPTQESSANYRLIEWRNAIISIHENPVYGIGLGGVMPMEIYIPRTNLLGVHNTYLWVAVKMGAIGLFTYLLLLNTYFRRLLQQNVHLRDPFLRSLSRGITCAFVAFLAAQMFAPMFQQMRTATWFGVILGLGMMLAVVDLGENDGEKNR